MKSPKPPTSPPWAPAQLRTPAVQLAERSRGKKEGLVMNGLVTIIKAADAAAPTANVLNVCRALVIERLVP
jgi:hypothetical protein